MKKKSVLASILFLLIVGSIWFFNKPYHYSIPMQLGRADTPITQIEIEGNVYHVNIDFGSKFPVTLQKNILEKTSNKKKDGFGKWKDVRGNEYVKPSYIIPKTKINCLKLKNVSVQEEDDVCVANTSTVFSEDTKGIPKTCGAIGRPLLSQKNLLLDYSNSVILLSNDGKKLKSLGYSIDKFVKVPFEMGKIGITLKVDTDLGMKRMSLDTGCTVNLIRRDFFNDLEYPNPKEWPGLPLYTTNSFVLGGEDLGSTNLYLYAITPELKEIDGFLGSPFLMKHVVYIDFENKMAYVSL